MLSLFTQEAPQASHGRSTGIAGKIETGDFQRFQNWEKISKKATKNRFFYLTNRFFDANILAENRFFDAIILAKNRFFDAIILS